MSRHTSSVMIVEDDREIADLLKETLEEAGYEVCGCAESLKEGLSLDARFEPALAIIDIHLAHDESGVELACRLSRRRRLGVLFASSHCHEVDSAGEISGGCLCKPYKPADVLRALRIVEQVMARGTASERSPRGFRLLRNQSC